VSRVLIAGCGYVGKELARRLVVAGHEVFGLRRRAGMLPKGTREIVADLADPESLAAVPAACDTVLFTAGSDASNDAAYRSVYVDGLRNLITVLGTQRRFPRRLVVVSSTAVYRQANGEAVDERSPTEASGFAATRLLEMEGIARQAPTTVVIVRFGGIYGPGRTRLLRQVKQGVATVSTTAAYTNRIHRDDCAGVLHHLIDLPDAKDLYLGVDDRPTDRRHVIEWLAAQLRVAPPRIDDSAPPPRTNKRCINARLRASLYDFRYPTYRDGYAPLIAEVLAREARKAWLARRAQQTPPIAEDDRDSGDDDS
jgi:nucleoside-diphosphate-sugar epimerase